MAKIIESDPISINFLGIQIPTSDLCPKPIILGYSRYRPRRVFEEMYNPIKPASHFFILNKGLVAVCSGGQNGNRVLIDLVKAPPPAILAPEALDQEAQYYRHQAEAIHDSVVTAVDRHLLDQILSYPGARERYCDQLQERMRVREDITVDSAKPVLARVARLLWFVAEGVDIDGSSRLQAPLTHQNLSFLISSTRESAPVGISEDLKIWVL